MTMRVTVALKLKSFRPWGERQRWPFGTGYDSGVTLHYEIMLSLILDAITALSYDYCDSLERM